MERLPNTHHIRPTYDMRITPLTKLSQKSFRRPVWEGMTALPGMRSSFNEPYITDMALDGSESLSNGLTPRTHTHTYGVTCSQCARSGA